MESIISNAVNILRNRFKNKKISSKDIIEVLDTMDGIDDEFEITDEIIDTILILYKEPPKVTDEEARSLREANKKFNQNVKGIIDIKLEDEEDDWIPISKVNDKTKQEWNKIQDKLDKIKTRFEEMTK